MGACPGIWRDPGPGPANPRDWDQDRDSKLRDSRDRDKILRDSPATKIPWDNKFSRHCPVWLSRGTSGTGTKNRGTFPFRPLPIPAINCSLDNNSN